MDELKNYFQQHTEDLNRDEPRPQVWQNILQQSQPVKKTGVVPMITRWIAAACILVMAGVGAWYVFSKKQNLPAETVSINAGKTKPATQPATIQNQPMPVEKKSPEEEVVAAIRLSKKNHPKQMADPVNSNAALAELHNIETSFTQVINLQRERISSIPMVAVSPDYFNDFKLQIRQMEKDEKAIKSDITRHGMNDVLLDQLINVYQQKLNVLKQLQLEMTKANNRFKQNHGPVDSTQSYFLKL
jgi:hypothetical protein